jgi:hypothetical protein
MQAMGFTCAEADDAYAAASELFRRPLVYRALVLSLSSLYREELGLIATLKRKLPHVDVWLTHLESRQAALAEAIRLGADGLLAEDGALHRMAISSPAETAKSEPPKPSATEPTPPLLGEVVAHGIEPEPSSPEPILSADELRAFLQEQPMSPPEMDA